MMGKFSMTIMELIEWEDFDLKLNYKIWNEEYRETLNYMIFEKFMFREICYKNPYRWLYEFNELLNRLMVDKYNKLYKLNANEDFNPLYNVDMTETFENETDVQGSGTSKNKGTNKSVTKNKTDTTHENGRTDNNSTTDKSLNIMMSYPQDAMLQQDLENVVYASSGQNSKTTTAGENKIDDKGKENIVIDASVDDTIDDNLETSNTNKVTHKSTHKTLGSSAGLPFSRAMQQYKDYIEDFMLHTELFNDLEIKFYQLYTGEE